LSSVDHATGEFGSLPQFASADCVEVLHLPSTTKLKDVIWNPIQT